MNPTRRAVWLVLAAVSLSASTGAQSSAINVTAAGTATYPPGTTYNGAVLTGMRAGFGVDIAGDGSAAGQFETTLLGPSSNIVVQGRATGGSNAGTSSATFSGTCAVDPGDGSAPATNTPFTATVTSDGAGGGTIAVTLGATTLSAATLTDGSLTIR